MAGTVNAAYIFCGGTGATAKITMDISACPDGWLSRAGEDKMTNYLRFASGEGEAADVLVEVDAAEDLPVAASRMLGCASGRGIRPVRRSRWPKAGSSRPCGGR